MRLTSTKKGAAMKKILKISGKSKVKRAKAAEAMDLEGYEALELDGKVALTGTHSPGAHAYRGGTQGGGQVSGWRALQA